VFQQPIGFISGNGYPLQLNQQIIRFRLAVAHLVANSIMHCANSMLITAVASH
jgi:hypothetical protein